MPYTPNSANLPKNVRNEPEPVRRQWCAVWNSEYEKRRKEGMSHKDAEARAFQLANGVLKKMQQSRGEGQGVGGPRQGDGGADICVCPKCGYETEHDRGTPCTEIKCAKCGTPMTGKTTVKESALMDVMDQLLLESGQREVSEETLAELNRIVDESAADTPSSNLEDRADQLLVEIREARLLKSEEGGVKLPKEAYAYVGDPEKVTTWKLPLWEGTEKKVTKAKLGQAAAALTSGGFRGQTVKLPKAAIPAVKARIRREYRKLGVPVEKMPRSLRESISRSLLEHITGIEITESVADQIAKGIVPVRVIKPGWNWDKTFYYTAEALADIAQKFEGIKMYCDHPRPSDDRELPERSVRDWVAVLRNCKVARSGAVVGEAHIHAAWFKELLAGMAEAGTLNEMGVSVVGVAAGARGRVEGHDTVIVESVEKARCCDFVTEPGAGGGVGFTESRRAELYELENDLDLVGESDLRERRPDLVTEIEAKAVREAKQKKEERKMDLEQELREVKESLAAAEKENERLKGELEAAQTKMKESEGKLAEYQKKEAQVEVQKEVDTILESEKYKGMPEETKRRVKAQFAESTSKEGIAEAVEEERLYLVELSKGGVVKDLGASGPPDADPEKVEAELRESFKRLHPEYTDEQLEVAVRGR